MRNTSHASRRPSLLSAAALALALASADARAAAGSDLFAPAATPVASAAAWSRALAANAPLAELDVLRPGSRALVRRRPELAQKLRERAQRLGDPARLERVEHGEWAALLSPIPSKLPPILLHFEDGVWRVDVVEIEKSYAPQEPGKLAPIANSQNPYRRLAPPPKRSEKLDLSEEDLLAEPIEEALARLGKRRDRTSRIRLAEILLNNCWLTEEALDVYEKLAREDEHDYALTERFAWVAWAVGQPDRAVPLAERWDPESLQLLGQLHQRAGRFEVAQQYNSRWLVQLLKARRPQPQAGAPAAPANAVKP